MNKSQVIRAIDVETNPEEHVNTIAKTQRFLILKTVLVLTCQTVVDSETCCMFWIKHIFFWFLFGSPHFLLQRCHVARLKILGVPCQVQGPDSWPGAPMVAWFMLMALL